MSKIKQIKSASSKNENFFISNPSKHRQYQDLEKWAAINYDFRENIITGAIEFKHKSSGEWSEFNEFNGYRKLRNDGLGCTMNDLLYLLKSDFVPKYNPIQNYFESLKACSSGQHPDWIKKTAGYVKAKNPQRFEKHFKKWLVRVIKCALEDDYVNKNAIILVQEKQNSGKTSFIRWLCPNLLRSYFTENISFDKDSMIALIENIIINLDELATYAKVEINALKSIQSKSFVNMRHPFERKAKRLPRRASFIGSTNMTEFLTDHTGNVRWIPFEIDGIDWNYSKDINIDDVWAQAYGLYKAGFACDVTAEEIRENELENRQFMIISQEMELLMKFYEPGTKDNHDVFKTTGEIELAIRENTSGMAKVSGQQLGKALRLLGFARDNRYEKDKSYPIKAYYLKFRHET